jgi:hypothetical protein
MHPMQEAEQASEPSPLIASAHEAVILRAYCESRWPVGQQSTRMHSITGERHTELACRWHDGFATAEAAREAAQVAFDTYAEGKSGTLYWRVPPEIAFGPKRRKYAYYLRLLISDKPHAKVST